MYFFIEILNIKVVILWFLRGLIYSSDPGWLGSDFSFITITEIYVATAVEEQK